MSDVYVARQPIFDRHMMLFGYELLYRKSHNNFYEGTDDDQATAALMDNLFFIGFDELIDGKLGFINFSQNMLMDNTPALLPKEKTVIEILERVDLNESVLEECRKLKQMGYRLALDDFAFSETNINNTALMDIVDIIKVENIRRAPEEQIRFIKKYKSRIRFLAERIETREEYNESLKMGYSLFQGFFFSKPVMFNATEIRSLDMNLIMILNELNRPVPDYKEIAGIIERDLGLSYKLLKIVNSAYFTVKFRIKSIQQALVHLGTQELYRWIHIMLLKGVQTKDNAELVKTSIIRGKMLSLLAENANLKHLESDFFITGIFSSIDVILNQDMQTVISGLPLTNDVQDALLGNDNIIRICLNAILDFERADWDTADRLAADLGFDKDTLMPLYLAAIKWQHSIVN